MMIDDDTVYAYQCTVRLYDISVKDPLSVNPGFRLFGESGPRSGLEFL